MSKLTNLFIPVGSFLLGGVGTYFGLDAYEKRQESYYTAFYDGLPEIQSIADPVERSRQLRKLRDLAESSYKGAFFRDIDALISGAAEAAEAQANAAVDEEKARLQRIQEEERVAREAEARRLAQLAEKKRKEEEEENKAAARANALRLLESEKVCRNESCSSFILR